MAEIAALNLIVPSSVTAGGGTATISASGKITMSSVTTSLSVNGAFSASYDNYLVVLRGTTTSGSGYDVRLRAAGSDNSTASSYVYQRIEASSTTLQAQRTTDSIGRLTSDLQSTTSYGFHAHFYGPYLAEPTVIRTTPCANANGAVLQDFAMTHNQSTSYDGFTLFIAAASTGSLTIYGLSQ